MNYFIIINGQPAGPYDLNALVAQGLTPASTVWCEGMSDWAPASTVPELAEYFNGLSAANKTDNAEWYLAVNGRHTGPFTAADLRNHGVNPSSMVWRQGMANWQPIASVPELSSVVFPHGTELYDSGKTAAAVYDNGMPEESPETEHPLTEEVTECPSNHLALAIIGIILFWPTGIGALVKAILVKKRWAEARYGDAVWLSRGAKSLGITSIILGAVFTALYILAFASEL